MSNNQEKEKLNFQMAKQAPLPANLPLYGGFSFAEITYVGRTDYTGGLEEKKVIFGIKRKDREGNVFILGNHGMGKSKLMEGMIRQEMEFNFGFILFDFDGELFENVLENIPSTRKNDVCVFDFIRAENLPAFNPLADINEITKSNFITAFLKILPFYFKEYWNPALEYLWLMILNTLIALKGAKNLGFIKDLIDDVNCRKEVVKFLPESHFRNFWEREYENWAKQFYKEAILPLNIFWEEMFLEPNIRKFFTFPKNLINIEDLVAQNKIILVKLPSSFLRKKVANFLMDLILLRLKNAGILRFLDKQNKELKYYYIYIDHLDISNSITLEDIVNFSREYKFSFTISNSSFTQITSSLVPLIFSSFSNLIFFRVSNSDILKLERELISSSIKIRDVLGLNIQEFYIKMAINGVVSDFFSAETLMIVDKIKGAAKREEILKNSSRFFIPLD